MTDKLLLQEAWQRFASLADAERATVGAATAENHIATAAAWQQAQAELQVWGLSA